MSVHENSALSHQQNEVAGLYRSWKERVLVFLRTFPELKFTDRHIAKNLNHDDMNTIRVTLTFLKKDGLIEEVGHTKCEYTGRKVRLIKLAEGR